MTFFNAVDSLALDGELRLCVFVLVTVLQLNVEYVEDYFIENLPLLRQAAFMCITVR